MVQLVLPGSNRRAMVRAFWFVLSLLTGVAVAAIIWGLQRPHPLKAGLICAALMAAFVFWQEPTAWRVYRVWNRWFARPVAFATSRVVLRICFLITRLAALGGAPRMQLGSERGVVSAWKPRSSLPAEAYPSLFFGPAGAAPDAGWFTVYYGWARQSGNSWAICLLPFLALLRRLDPEEEKAFTANIYTLF